MKLPDEYEAKMIRILGEEEFKAYAGSLDAPRMSGMRINTLKIRADDFEKKFYGITGITKKVPWEPDGYYYGSSGEEALQPGRLPLYHAGLYYIQEPSAMYPASQLGVRPGDRVLDMCAAPGGKSTKIACELNGSGLLVANDISEERVKALIYNIELSGARNVIVTNESPERLAAKLPGYFDKILVDAPCSGEGMFRKDSEAIRSWGKYKNESCASMQREILEYAHVLLKSGGRMMYSTCTFDPSEDEYMIREFIEKHPEYSLIPLAKTGGVADGMFGMTDCARLWPHRLEGEGHFAALMQKGSCTENGGGSGAENSAESCGESCGGRRGKNEGSRYTAKTGSYKVLVSAPDEFGKFWQENMTGSIPEGIYYTAADALYFLPDDGGAQSEGRRAGPLPPDVDGLRVPKLGLRLGDMPAAQNAKKSPRPGKFRPSQQFCMAFGADFKRKINLPYDGDDIKRYLRGETLTGTDVSLKGLTAVCAEGYAVGMGVSENGMLKNLYPKGWRRMI